MVVPFPPGAASDFLARVLGQKLTEAWGQQVVVDNRPGAGGLIGGTVVARSNPDGYTIALIGQPHLTATLLSKEPPWDPFKDFAHIGLVATDAERRDGRPRPAGRTRVAELITQVKAKPGSLQRRLGRRRQLLAPRRRDVQRGGGPEGRARSVQADRRHRSRRCTAAACTTICFPVPAAMPALQGRQD